MIKFWSIAQNTFVQIIRQPIYGIILLVTIMVLLGMIPLSMFTMGEKGGDYKVTDQRMLIQLSLTNLLLAAALLAALCASSALSREIEERTALTVLAKPVSRAIFVLGKFAGLAAAVLTACYILSLVMLMTVRHGVLSAVSDPYDVPVITFFLSGFFLAMLAAALGNIFFGWHFVSALTLALVICMSVAMGLIGFIGPAWTVIPFGEGLSAQLLVGLALILMAVMVLTAVAVAASTRLGLILTLLVCLGVTLVGTIYPALFGKWQDKIVLVQLISPLVPNLTYFFALDAIAKNQPITADYVALAGLYCLLYVAGILALGVALFQRRNLQADEGSATMPAAVSLLGGLGRLGAALAGLLGIEALAELIWSHASGSFEPILFRFFSSAAGSWGGGLAIMIALLPIAVLAWAIWTCFGRGFKWAYWTILVLAAVKALYDILGLALPGATWLPGHFGQGTLAIALAAAGIVLLILMFPSTRRHFKPIQGPSTEIRSPGSKVQVTSL